jgi:DNA repair protein RadC
MQLLDIPKQTRPREKLLAMGSQALTDAELLAVMLGSGLPGQNVLQLAQSLLDQFDGLAGLLHAPSAALQARRGLGGSARRAQLMAVLELSRRVLLQKMRQRDAMSNPDTVQHFLQLQLGTRDHEVFAVMFLDGQNRLLRFEEMFKGTINQTSVYPREVVRDALLRNSCALVLVHNHPSGAARPSRADEYLTQTLKQAAALADVRVLDHFIVAGDAVNSMAELGLV